MLVALLFLAATALGSDVFPAHMCERLPEVDPVVKAQPKFFPPTTVEESSLRKLR